MDIQLNHGLVSDTLCGVGHIDISVADFFDLLTHFSSLVFGINMLFVIMNSHPADTVFQISFRSLEMLLQLEDDFTGFVTKSNNVDGVIVFKAFCDGYFRIVFEEDSHVCVNAGCGCRTNTWGLAGGGSRSGAG
jgi:hypothetical protein